MTTTSLQSDRLDDYYRQMNAMILSRQHPVSGLLPASTAVNIHGDYTDAWVRDNVYSILAVWGLALAYRKDQSDPGRTLLLEQSVVRLMRGLLRAMMRQAHKVETFKHTQAPLDALHAKYDTPTGDVVVDDDAWGHLQIDATSLFLLMMAQMTASGLLMVYSLDEVHFVQNLVYYISRAYRTPDYGIWERGNKINTGTAEINASSVGMAKAALEAMNGLNIMGARGGPKAVIHVMADEIARTEMKLAALLPRESKSKEVDAAVLSVIGFPAFAVCDRTLVDRTRTKIIDKLQGRYGCKRFLRDGHQTVLEDHTRLHYETWELKQFEDIESEWPLFFTYSFLDSLFRGDTAQSTFYKTRLQALGVEQDGWSLLPELYIVPEEQVEAEKAVPHSQDRVPNQNIPLVWAQSLYLLGQLVDEGLITLDDIDPLGRHHQTQAKKLGTETLQVALLAEDQALQETLAAAGITAETLEEIAPLQVRPAHDLTDIYHQLGQNLALGLSGRPHKRMRTLMTSHLYRVAGETMVFLPSFIDNREFYLTLDIHFLISQIQSELAYVQRYWIADQPPTLTLLLTHRMLKMGQAPLMELLQSLASGESQVSGQIQVGVLSDFIDCSAVIDIAGLEQTPPSHDYGDQAPTQLLSFKVDHCHPLPHLQEQTLELNQHIDTLLSTLKQSENLYEQVEILHLLIRQRSLDDDISWASDQTVSLRILLTEVYLNAAQAEHWSIVRRAAGLLNMVDISLSDAVTNLLAHQKQILVGRSYNEHSLINMPLSAQEIVARINEFCREDERDRVLTQEILIYLDLLTKSKPLLVKGLLTLRIGYLILLLTTEIAREQQVTQDEAYETLTRLSPYHLKSRLRQVLSAYDQVNKSLHQQESLHIARCTSEVNWGLTQPILQGDDSEPEDWLVKRQVEGSLNRVPREFYIKVWRLLQHTHGIVIGEKLDRRNRLDSEHLLSEMTEGETNFALLIEHLLNRIPAPEYRQLNVEALLELAHVVEANPDLQFDDHLVLDVIIGHAVRLAWWDAHPERVAVYDEDKARAWQAFYKMPAQQNGPYVVMALRFLIEVSQTAMAV
ncbi:glycoside hydrolase family 15 protein [Acaryochloris sp. IP29b_bin.137]|uniref:glycoside hydrolase family 15 protein n=1 Tax=Acaryochloris sp. IP29b_bin.137 TaxID=2969217 RepID=UPI002628DA1B|nr:glycoside hydrolase family 15 protein [Acaryochloris sp. IP29b_bin.137]